MVASATKLITCQRCQRIRPHHSHGNCHGCYVSARRECDDRCDGPPVNLDRVDRLALAWMMFCRDDSDDAVSVACGVGLDVVREYRREMPKWWAREFRIERAGPLGPTDGRVMKTAAARAKQRERRLALARFLLLRGPLTFMEIESGHGAAHTTLTSDLRCEWFERVVAGYRLSPWRLTAAGRAALAEPQEDAA